MGVNCISFGLNHGDPMRDVAMRAEKHGIKLHIATGGTHPCGLNFDTIRDSVGSFDIARSSAVFSYDLGWEVHVGGYEVRRAYNEKWTRWIKDNYGSLENAFDDWNYTPPADLTDPSLVDGPTDEQITDSVPVSLAYIAAYRRFMDEVISKGYQYSVRELRKYDPLTLMGARSGYGGTGAEGVAAVMPFDLKAGVRHLDYTAPEAYNIGADRAGFLKGHLNNVYGRFVSQGKPVMWPEYGSPLFYSGGGVTRYTYRPGAGYSRLANEAAYYAGMADFIIETKANGALGWWFPGGYRVDEMSDFGITNHDGTLRPAGAMIMEKSPLIVKGFGSEEREKEVFEIDRDLYPSGYAGLFTEFAPKIADSFMSGKAPVLKTAATGTTTADVPRIAVGNTPYREGKNPIKYLSSEFDYVRIGKTEVIESADVTLPRGKAPVLECSVANTDEPLWLSAPGAGQVSLSVTAGGRTVYYPIKGDTAMFESAEFKGIKLTGEPEEMVLRMYCEGIGAFGETVRLKISYK
ncbi:MAG: hypothetical protein IJT95_02590, partial [Abditibacteriota bacterium]|nr:hypothetical protein [Abditibacteriota bacterium]